MKKFIPLSIFFLIHLTVFCQSKTFTLTINSDNTKFALTYCGLRATLNYDPDTSFAIVPNKDYTITKKIHAPGFYQIMDGDYGHIIFIEPGDKININLKIKDSLYLKQENKYNHDRTLRKMIASSKHSGNLTFFDTYYNKVDYGFKPELFESWQDFPKRVSEAFYKGIFLLQEFDDKGLVTADFKKFAKVYLEIDYL